MLCIANYINTVDCKNKILFVASQATMPIWVGWVGRKDNYLYKYKSHSYKFPLSLFHPRQSLSHLYSAPANFPSKRLSTLGISPPVFVQPRQFPYLFHPRQFPFHLYSTLDNSLFVFIPHQTIPLPSFSTLDNSHPAYICKGIDVLYMCHTCEDY